MPTPGDFNWRPNDNSAKTLLRYELEAEKWVNAVNSAQRKTMTRSLDKDFVFIGLIIQLLFCLLLLVLLFFMNIFKWMLRSVRIMVESSCEAARRTKEGVGEERVDHVQEMQVKRRQPNPILYDSNGELWGIWDFLVSFIFIFICVYVVIGVGVHFFKPEFDMADHCCPIKNSEPKIQPAKMIFLFYHKLKYHEQKCKLYRTAYILSAVKFHSKEQNSQNYR